MNHRCADCVFGLVPGFLRHLDGLPFCAACSTSGPCQEDVSEVGLAPIVGAGPIVGARVNDMDSIMVDGFLRFDRVEAIVATVDS